MPNIKMYRLRRLLSVLLPSLLLASVLSLPLVAHSEDGSVIQFSSVVVEGTKRIDPAAIRAQLSKSSGSLSRQQVSDEIKAIYKTGFFDEVTAALRNEGEKNALVYSVTEKPVVNKVFIKGNKEIGEKDLVSVITLDSRRFFDKAKVAAIIRNTITYYQSRGFLDAGLEYSVVPVGDAMVDLTFNVKEGEKFSISEIAIEGLSEIDPDTLRDVIQTKRYKWYSSWIYGTGRVNQEMLENDKLLIRQYFFDNGYLDGTIAGPRIERGQGTDLKVVFEAHEGQQYRIGAIDVRGDLVEGSSEKTLEGIKSKQGEIFSASKIRADAFTISDKFGDKGFAFANVTPDTSINRAGQRVNVVFEASKGKEVSINHIDIRGNDKTYDNVIRRTLVIQEQEQFSTSKVKRSQQLLQRLGYFEEATITTEPSAEPDKVDLKVNVRESSTGSFSIGAGYSSSDGAIFNSRLSEANILGTGRRFDFNVDVGTQRNNINISLDDPRFNDSYWAVGADVMATEREFTDFDRQLAGGGVSVGYPLEQVFGESFQDVNFSLKYEYLDIDISDVDDDAAQLVQDSEGNSTASGVTPRFTRSTINNPLNPTRGSKQVFEVELTGLGGDEKFYLFEFRNQFYHPVFEGDWGELVFSWRTTVGYGESFDEDNLPLYRRYFPGGINSVRGYKARTLGPKDEKGNEYGGSKELVNNLEMIFPLVNSAGLKGIFFYDVGEAFDDNESLRVEDLRQAYGTGIRWNSPLGPIRLEFGFPIAREDGEKSVVTLFAFGAPF